jgi:hypothetical protein
MHYWAGRVEMGSMAAAQQNDHGWREEVTRTPSRRVPVDDNRFTNGLLLLWLYCMTGVALWLVYLVGQHGGLETAVARTRSSENNWIRWTIMAMATPTVLLIITLPTSYRAVVFSSRGIALEQFGRTVWRLPWTDYAGWFWYRDARGELVALRFADRSGGYREIRGWNSNRLPAVFEVLDALTHWTPGRAELPSVTVTAHEAWFAELMGALVIGLVVLVGFGGVVLMVFLWK